MESDWIQIVCWNRIVEGVIIRNSPAECWGFFRDLYLHFPLHHELHLTVEVNLLHIPKQWEVGVFMKWAKRQVAVWEISETGRTTEILGRRFWWSEKVWPCSLLLRMICFGFVKPICWPRAVARWPFPRKNSDPCVCAKISGIAMRQTVQLVRRKYLAKGCFDVQIKDFGERSTLFAVVLS